MIAIAFSVICNANAQKKPKINIWNPPVQKGITALKIGDRMPDFKIKVFNDTKKTASISDYSDRLLILDFGNTGCAGCIEALPHMDRLQKQFGKQIKIFWVTPEYYEDVERFWNRKGNKYTNNNSLPTIVEDSTARAYFLNKTWPYEVWIYKGKVIAMTDAEYVDENNIKKVLSGAQINWVVKTEYSTFDGRKTPLFLLDSNQINAKNTFIKYAAISDYVEGRTELMGGAPGEGIVRDPVKKTVRYYLTNCPVFDAYMKLWGRVLPKKPLITPSGMNFPFGPNEVSWEVSDKNKYKYFNGYRAEWDRKNSICFESLNVDSSQSDQQVYLTAIMDLNRLLGLNARWEKRKEKVLVLVKTGNLDPYRSKVHATFDAATHQFSFETYVQNGNLHQFRDNSLSNIVSRMNQQADNPYVFDETGYEDRLDMDLNFSSWTDIAGIRKAIAPYGLDLKEEERLVDKFVFTEVNGGMLVMGVKKLQTE